jgi:hypothetical protein
MPNYNLRFNVNVSHTSKHDKRGSVPQNSDDTMEGDIVMDTKHVR